MRTIQSLERELRKLRSKHTQSFKDKDWTQLRAIDPKIIRILNQITALDPKWFEKDDGKALVDLAEPNTDKTVKTDRVWFVIET